MTDNSLTIAGIPLQYSLQRQNDAAFRNSDTYKNFVEMGIDPKYAWDNDKPPADDDDQEGMQHWVDAPYLEKENQIEEAQLTDQSSSYGETFASAG